MKTIYKYPLEKVKQQTLVLPKNAEILTVQIQREEAVLWAKIDSDQFKTENRTIVILATGEEIDYAETTLIYISTVQTEGGYFVFHIFEYIGI